MSVKRKTKTRRAPAQPKEQEYDLDAMIQRQSAATQDADIQRWKQQGATEFLASLKEQGFRVFGPIPE